MKVLSGLDWVALILVVVGAVNWGLVGVFEYNLVNALLGAWPTVERVVYTIVGVAGLYVLISLASKKA